MAHGSEPLHGAPSGSATCVHPVAGSQASAVHGLPSSHWNAVVQPRVWVVLVELEVDVDVEDVVAEVELEDEVLVEVEVLVVGCLVEVVTLVEVVE